MTQNKRQRLLKAAEHIAAMQDAVIKNSEQRSALYETVKRMGFLTEETEPLFRSSPAALLEFPDVSFIHTLPFTIDRIQKMKGPKGEDGYTPVKGVDYFDGEKGEPGQSVKGDRGTPGRDGADGKDADIQDLIPLMNTEVDQKLKEHEKEFNHDLIHDPKMLGPLEIDMATIQEEDFLQVKNKKIVGVKLPKVKPAISHGASSTTSGRYRIKTITQSETLDPLDQIIHVNASTGNITLTFYSASGQEGSHHFIKRIDNTLANTVSFAMTGSETLDFETLYQLVNQGSGAEVYTDGSNWFLKHA